MMCLKVHPSDIIRFYPLLQAGIILRCRVGVSLAVVFRETLELTGDYVEKAISTVFMNGKPVDDIETTIVTDGSAVALSSAMPGLVGRGNDETKGVLFNPKKRYNPRLRGP
jgi:hypothetical protein